MGSIHGLLRLLIMNMIRVVISHENSTQTKKRTKIKTSGINVPYRQKHDFQDM